MASEAALMFVEEKREGEAEQTLEPWRRVLLTAVNTLKRKGWCQNGYRTRKGYCAIGAVYYGVKDKGKATEKAAAALNLLAQQRYGLNILSWNDVPGRTKAEVIALMLDTARGDGRGSYLGVNSTNVDISLREAN